MRTRVARSGAVLAAAVAASWLSAGCGSKKPTDADTLPPFVQWVRPTVSGSILDFPADTVTVELSAADDGGVVSQVTVYLQGAPVATLTSAPFRHLLDLSSLGRNRPGSVFATATDRTGKIGSTEDTLRLMVRPQDTVTWTMLAPARVPAPRVGHTWSLDASQRRAILFGGESFVTFEAVNDTWIFDMATDSWDSVAVAAPPPARKDHGAGVVGGTLVVFGGEYLQGGADSVLQDFALLDIDAPVWYTNLFTPIFDPIRSMGTAVLGSRVYAYGGSSIVTGAANDSTLRWFDLSDTSWSEGSAYTNGPRVRVDAAVAADLEANRIFVYGGAPGVSNLPTDASQYRFSPTVDSWSSVPQLPQVVPPVTRAAVVYDSLNNRLLVWGGIDNAGGLPTDVWELSLGNLRWRTLASAGAVPSGRTEHEMVIDRAVPRIIMFGGRVGGVGVAETWEVRW